MTGVRRAAYFVIPPLVCLYFYWRVPFTWFLSDDFAWLGVPLEVHNMGDFWHIMFVPKAQGTIRVLSERLFFFAFSSAFGLNALPYHLWVLATWFADLTLASLIGARLTGSRVAGMLAAILWTSNAVVATPLLWVSAYNEVLCGFFILAAFYARLRGWTVAEWVAYLLGFGALEVMVMYPALAALHALCTDRKRVWKTLPLFVPAVAFAALHFLLVPQNPGAVYNLEVDGRMPGTFLHYLMLALGPSRLGEFGRRELILIVAIGVALAGFLVWRIRRREYLAVFCCGWFVLMLAPVLPLPNHWEDYYATLPMLGLAWLGGWALASAWDTGWVTRAVAAVLLVYFLALSRKEISVATNWYRERTNRMEVLVLGVRDSARAHPGSAFLLQGVGNDLFNSGFQDDPFRLFGVDRVYLVGSTDAIQARADLGGLSRFVVPSSHALALLETGKARALAVSPDALHDVTNIYRTILRADPAASRHDFVDVADPLYASLLGPTWYPVEGSFRWMPKTATVRLSGPRSLSVKLHVTGFAPAPALASGPVTLKLSASGHDLGSTTLRQPDQSFALEYAMPSALVGQQEIEISIDLSKTFRPGKEGRDLGLVFGTFGIR